MIFRKLRRDETRAGMDAIDRLWKKGHILATNEDLFRWQYGQDSDPEKYSFLVAEEAGDIVGFSGMIVLPWHLGGNYLRGGSGALTIMGKDWRTGTNGLKLLENADKDYDVVGSIGIPARVAQLYQLQGRFVSDAFPRMLALTELEQAANYLKEAHYPPTQMDLCLQSLGRLRRLSPSPAYSLKKADSCTLSQWDECWKKNFEKHLSGVARNSQYIKWRYLDHPSFDYKVFYLTKSDVEICGLLVYRLVPLGNNLSVLRIMDFLGAGELAAQNLAAYLSQLIPENCVWSEFYCFGNFGHPLKHIGFNNKGSGAISVWTNPPDPRQCQIRLSFNVKIANMEPSALAARNDLYFTIADGDQDRPN